MTTEEINAFNCGYGNRGSGSWVAYLFIFLIILFVGGLFLAHGNDNRRDHKDTYKATCDAEKSEIINTARTQYLTEQQGAQTRELMTTLSNNQMMQANNNFVALQMADKNKEIDNLRGLLANATNQINLNNALNPIKESLADLSCNCLKKPNITGVGVSCPSAGILNGFGFNTSDRSNSDCGCRRLG